ADRAVHQEPYHVVLQVDAVEDHAGAARALRCDRDPASVRGRPVVEDDGIGDEQLAVVARLEGDAESAANRLQVPDHAVLDVDGRRLQDENAAIASDLPVNHQAAQADDVASSGTDADADVGGRDQDAGFAGIVVGDVDRPG